MTRSRKKIGVDCQLKKIAPPPQSVECWTVMGDEPGCRHLAFYQPASYLVDKEIGRPIDIYGQRCLIHDWSIIGSLRISTFLSAGSGCVEHVSMFFRTLLSHCEGITANAGRVSITHGDSDKNSGPQALARAHPFRVQFGEVPLHRRSESHFERGQLEVDQSSKLLIAPVVTLHVAGSTILILDR